MSGGGHLGGTHTSELLAQSNHDDIDNNLSVGRSVLVHGLSRAQHLNNLVGVITGYDAQAERYIVRFAPNVTPSKIKACNLMFPVQCPHCSSEVTGSHCHACASGKLLLHESLRIGNSCSMNDLQTEASLSRSRPLPGPGTRSGTSSSMQFNDADDNESSKHLYSDMQQVGAMTPANVASKPACPCKDTQ